MTIASIAVSQTEHCDKTIGLTSFSAVVTITLNRNDVSFFDDPDARAFERVPNGPTKINVHPLLDQCTFAYDIGKRPTISDDGRSMTLHYKSRNATRHPDTSRESFTDGVQSAGKRFERGATQAFRDSYRSM